MSPTARFDDEKPTVAHLEQNTTVQATDGHTLFSPSTHDTEKASGLSGAYAGSVIGQTLQDENKKAERKLLLKLDVVILPLAMLLYLAAYLDRGNLGNAKLLGLLKGPLHNNSDAYSLALACFYITYIVFSIPGTLLAKAISPSTSIAAGAMIWSIAATCQAAITSPAGLYVCRLFVGLGEAMFGQAMALYFSYWYAKDEIAKRVSFFIGCGALAGAFGGLISYGVAHINSGTFDAANQFRVLFLIEGCPSVLLAIVVFFCLPSRPQKSRYLNENERTLAITRLNADSLNEGNSGIDWNGVKRAFVDWKTYVVAVMYSAMNLGLGSVSGFLPTIVQGLGYSGADAQLYTVPPYAVAFVFMLLLAAISDRYKTRGIPAACVFLVGIVGWSILLGINPGTTAHKATASALHARYFGVICVVVAGYALIPIAISWQSNNTGSQSQRAVSLGMLNTVGQCLSVLASYSFPSAQGPKYTKGIALNVAFQSLGFLIALFMTLYYRWENKRRDRVEGGRPPVGTVLETIEKHDLAPGFRYVP